MIDLTAKVILKHGFALKLYESLECVNYRLMKKDVDTLYVIPGLFLLPSV